MATANPDILVRRGIEPGLVATIAVSALIHAALVAVVVTVPGQFLSAPPKLESYTVDLVAPDIIGGTNLIAGSGKAKDPVSPPAPPAAEPQRAPEPAVAQPAVVPPAAAPAAQLPPAAPPPAAEAPKPIAVQKPPEPPRAAQPAPKPAEPLPVVAAKPAAAKPVAPVKPAPAAEAKPPEAKPVVKPPEPAKAVAKVAEPPPKPAPPAASQPAAKPAAAEAPKKPIEPTKADAAAKHAKTRDDAIASAVQRRAAQVQGGATDARDQQIAAAVQRRSQQVQQGAGAGASETGGPISVGPGSGTGGTPADLQYILYQGRMEERIKAAWAWAGADKSLRAVIQFNLDPDGDIKNVRTVESSGDRQYDASCERAVRAVNPLEAVPDKYREQFATVEMTFKPSDLEH